MSSNARHEQDDEDDVENISIDDDDNSVSRERPPSQPPAQFNKTRRNDREEEDEEYNENELHLIIWSCLLATGIIGLVLGIQDTPIAWLVFICSMASCGALYMTHYGNVCAKWAASIIWALLLYMGSQLVKLLLRCFGRGQ